MEESEYENDELLLEVAREFMNWEVELTLVPDVQFTIDEVEYQVKTVRCSTEWEDDIEDLIEELDPKRIFLYSAFYLKDLEGVPQVCFRYTYS